MSWILLSFSIKNALISILNFFSFWETLNSKEIIVNKNGSFQIFFNARDPVFRLLL